MNASQERRAGEAKVKCEHDQHFDQARRLFPVESLQHLDLQSAGRCQNLLGHGEHLGIWETPEALIGRRELGNLRRIDLRRRLTAYLPQDIPASPHLDSLLDEGVLCMTRYALLMRLGPAGMSNAKGRPLDATTIAQRLYQYVARILSKGILCRLNGRDVQAKLVGCLGPEDVSGLMNTKHEAIELKRMGMLVEMGLWNDAPPKADIRQATRTKGDAATPKPEAESNPYQPIPDAYMAEMGPRVLWLVQDLGPNLLHLFESLPDLFGDIQFGPDKERGYGIKSRLRLYFESNIWRDRVGQVIVAPPFSLTIGSGRGAHKMSTRLDRQPWPPRNWEHLKILSATLQSAHLWIALLAMAGRIGEVSNLNRNCIEWARDGKPYINGKDYKLSPNLAGTGRDWPAPDAFVQALSQQVRLVSAWKRIARVVKGGETDSEPQVVDEECLWVSLGAASSSNPEEELSSFRTALQKLALRIGLTANPGGRALHPHRFRKTIARLAGIAIVDSPRVLMKLLGHRDIEMTLHYILTDKALQVEIDQVARELRIMRCQDLVEDIHTAIHTPGSSSFGDYGGGGAPVLAGAVTTYEEELHRSGRLWNADSSYELSVILTGNGQYFRTTRPGVICIKESRAAGPCTCDSSCTNRIEEKTIRRDIREIIPILIEQAKRALAENQLLVVAAMVQQIDEDLVRFDDIRAEFEGHPELPRLREAVS